MNKEEIEKTKEIIRKDIYESFDEENEKKIFKLEIELKKINDKINEIKEINKLIKIQKNINEIKEENKSIDTEELIKIMGEKLPKMPDVKINNINIWR